MLLPRCCVMRDVIFWGKRPSPPPSSLSSLPLVREGMLFRVECTVINLLVRNGAPTPFRSIKKQRRLINKKLCREIFITCMEK